LNSGVVNFYDITAAEEEQKKKLREIQTAALRAEQSRIRAGKKNTICVFTLDEMVKGMLDEQEAA